MGFGRSVQREEAHGAILKGVCLSTKRLSAFKQYNLWSIPVVRQTPVHRPLDRAPPTNRRVEGFNRRVNEVVARTRFASAAPLHETALHGINVSNQGIPQRRVSYRFPIQTRPPWQLERPALFHTGVANQPGSDTFEILAVCPRPWHRLA